MSINDFTYEPLSELGVLSGGASYYIVLHYRLADIGTGTTAIPPLNAVMNCFYYPYMDGEINYKTNGNVRTTWQIAESMEQVRSGNYHTCAVKMDGDQATTKITNIYGMSFVYVEGKTQITIDDNTKGQVLRPEKILKLPLSEKDKTLFTFDAYYQKPSTVGGNTFTWKNESKCYQYPYRYLEFNDGFSQPFYVAPQHLKLKTNNEFHVRHGLNAQGIYELYIKGYKGDDNGYYQAKQVNGIAVPINKDAYYNYMNENKNQRNMFYLNAIADITVGSVTGNIGQAVSGVSSAVNKMAMESDMKRLPDAITLGGSYDYGLQKSMYLYEIEHMVNEQDMERIGLFFHHFGYAQNKLMQPTYKGRKYWNYLKTNGVNLKVNDCPKEHLQQLKAIFDNGVTVWHWENGNMYENTEKDNVEV